MAMNNEILSVQNAIAAAINAITSASAAYNFDLNGPMKFGAPDVDQVVSGRPEVFLDSFEEENLMRTGNVIRKRLNFVLVGITGAEQRFDDLGKDTLKLGADIERAMQTDLTLGNVVDIVIPMGQAVQYYSEPSKGVVRAEFYTEYSVTVGTP